MAQKTNEQIATQVRVLFDSSINGVSVPAGRAALVLAELLPDLIAVGAVDDNAEAVAYALSVGDLIDTTVDTTVTE